MKSGFYSLCYHYVRKNCDDPLPRLLGTKISDFNDLQLILTIMLEFDL